jgi:hypothetical protein
VDIDSPSVAVLSTGKAPQDTLHEVGPLSLPFKSVSVRGIELRRGDLFYSRVRERDTLQFRVDNIDLTVGRMEVDSVVYLRRLPEVEDLQIITGRMSLSPAGEGLALEIKGICGGLASRSLTIDSLRLHPLDGKREFPLRTPGRDWMSLTVGRLALSGGDLRGALDGRGVHADSLAVIGAVIESFKNRQVAVPPREKQLLHRLLRQIPIPLAISVVQVGQSTAIDEELPAGGQPPGLFFMDGISARFDSLTNIDGGNDHIDIGATARVMGRGALNMDLELPVRDGDDHFMIRARLGAMPLKAFEAMTVPLGHIGLRSGRLQSLYMTMEGDAHGGVVNMRMAYDSLSLDVLNRQGLRSWLGSAAVNALAIRDANPMPGDELREVHASAQRDPYRSNFNYWWRVVFAGVKQSAGFSSQMQSEIGSLQKIFQNYKKRREERRARRGYIVVND